MPSGITTFESASSTTHQLFLIVPSVVGSTQTTCSNGQPGITIGSDTAFNSTVDVMDYTPCTIDISGNTTGSGQVYGGQTIDASQNFTATYYPLVVPGATGGGQVVGSTTMSVVYERQLSSLADA